MLLECCCGCGLTSGHSHLKNDCKKTKKQSNKDQKKNCLELFFLVQNNNAAGSVAISELQDPSLILSSCYCLCGVSMFSQWPFGFARGCLVSSHLPKNYQVDRLR